jgi:hypothetical protein
LERSSVGSIDLLWWMNTKINLNLRYSRNNQLSFFFNKYREIVQLTVPDEDQKNFLTALSYKNEGVLKSMHSEAVAKNERSITGFFEEAVLWYRKVKPAYLQQMDKIIGNSGADEMNVPRKTLFIYPDLRLRYMPIEPRAFMHFYFTDLFMEFIINKNLFDEFYPGKVELTNVSDWLSDYNVKMFVPISFYAKAIRYDILQKIAQTLESRNAEQSQDFNLLYLNLGLNAQQAGDQKNMLRYYGKMQPDNFLNILRNKEYANNVNDQSFRLIAFAVKGLTEAGRNEDAQRIIRVFKKAGNRSSLYAFAAAEMLNEKKDAGIIQALIDSSRNELNRSQNLTGFQPNRLVLSYALALQDPKKNMPEINKLIKNLPQKLFPIQSVSRAYAFNNQLYNARTLIPGLISNDDLADSFWYLHGQ